MPVASEGGFPLKRRSALLRKVRRMKILHRFDGRLDRRCTENHWLCEMETNTKTVTIQAEIPVGYEAVRFGVPVHGDSYIQDGKLIVSPARFSKRLLFILKKHDKGKNYGNCSYWPRQDRMYRSKLVNITERWIASTVYTPIKRRKIKNCCWNKSSWNRAFQRLDPRTRYVPQPFYWHFKRRWYDRNMVSHHNNSNRTIRSFVFLLVANRTRRLGGFLFVHDLKKREANTMKSNSEKTACQAQRPSPTVDITDTAWNLVNLVFKGAESSLRNSIKLGESFSMQCPTLTT